MDEAFHYQVETDKHSGQVFLYVRAKDDDDEYTLSLGFTAINAADLAAQLMNAARDVLNRG